MITGKSDNLVKELFAAGAHFGYSRSRNHPSVKPFLYGFKGRDAIIDLTQTVGQLAAARAFLTSLGAAGKTVLLIGNKNDAKAIVERVAQSAGWPYVASRWLGGTFTNWSQIKSRIDRMHDLKAKREKGELAVYTKKERLHFDREIARLERYLLSIATLTALPAAVVVVDPRQEAIVVTEAGKVGIPVVALAGSDCDLRGIAYPVVANDANIKSIKLFVEQMIAAYEAGKMAAQSAPATEAAETKNG